VSVLDRFRLDGKVAIVTGASSGLGAVTARCLAEAGADLVLAARRTDKLEETASVVRGLGRRAVVIGTDVAVQADCQRMVDAGVAELGAVDVLVNNAGLGWGAPASREQEDDWRRVIDINLSGSFWCAQAFGRVAPRGSSIVNVSSVLALRPFPLPQAAYAASKAGLLGMTRDLATQWGTRKGIRVNALAPGLFPTEMSADYSPENVAAIQGFIPLGRLGDPEEIGAAVLYLASEASSYVTGETLVVDGGLAMH